MDGEIRSFIKVWLSVFASLCCCYLVGKTTPAGKFRVVSILPIICLFLILPLNISSIHLGGFSSFFIAWLANFKLLLFCFGRGPLSSDPPISLPRFIAIACLPIKIQQENKNMSSSPTINTRSSSKSPLNYAIKGLLMAVLLRGYDYSQYIHPQIVLLLYCFYMYFCIEIILALVAALARALLKLEFEPQFDEPYLSTSLQDFWGRRWNLMATSILRPTVYQPVCSACKRVVGRRWASLPAVMATFVVSGLMHELIMFYLGRAEPTWEITCFFLLHGACLVLEIGAKKVLPDRWRLPRIVSGPLTFGFVMVTGFWLFLPPFLRCKAHVRGMQEYAALMEFVKDTSTAVLGWRVLFSNGTTA